MEIKILHMYYDIMNLYGEYANILILEKHLKEQGFDVIVDKKTINDSINLEEYDFIYMGSGTEKNQLVVLKDIKKYKEDIEKCIEKGKVMVFTGNSYELLGKSITDINQEYYETLNIFDYETKRVKDRVISDIVYESKYFGKKIVGFVNRGSNIYSTNNHLFKVKFGIGENEESKNEGIKYINFYGTYVIGPILIRNPELLEKIIIEICLQRDKNFEYKQIAYINETKSYNFVLDELEKRMKM